MIQILIIPLSFIGGMSLAVLCFSYFEWVFGEANLDSIMNVFEMGVIVNVVGCFIWITLSSAIILNTVALK